MFKKTIFSYAVGIVGAIAAWLFLTLHVSNADRLRYKKLQEKGRAIARASYPASTKQNRAGVRKDLWITQPDGTRLHDRIESSSSILTLTPIDDHLEIIETLNQIHCSMQERLMEQNGKPFQQIRYFEATSGIYQYSTSRFKAEAVSLALFRLPGNQLPISLVHSTPYLRGVAQDVSFAVAGKASQFQAKNFKASFASQKEKTP